MVYFFKNGICCKYFLLYLDALQTQNLDLNNVTPVKIFELMFQSPENSISQDDANPNSKKMVI